MQYRYILFDASIIYGLKKTETITFIFDIIKNDLQQKLNEKIPTITRVAVLINRPNMAHNHLQIIWWW